MDRINPKWREEYFKHPFSTDTLFEKLTIAGATLKKNQKNKVKGVGQECPTHTRYFRRAPMGTSSKKAARTGFPPSREAATIMPLDSKPRSLRGARFATMTTFLPTRLSGA